VLPVKKASSRPLADVAEGNKSKTVSTEESCAQSRARRNGNANEANPLGLALCRE
jgi:hypothetical protein